jgi:hypothetical protein
MADVEAVSKIRHQLRSLARQYEVLADDLEFCVSANGSNKATAAEIASSSRPGTG